jgi:hypothetical protein
VKPCRVLITGASGSGTSTLARALADRWSVPCFDTDDFFWLPGDPPYRLKRDPAERIRLMEQLFLPRPAWILAGSLIGWGDALAEKFDLVVFLRLDPTIRLRRLQAREEGRYGPKYLAPGGAGHAAHAAFAACTPTAPGWPACACRCFTSTATPRLQRWSRRSRRRSERRRCRFRSESP